MGDTQALRYPTWPVWIILRNAATGSLDARFSSSKMKGHGGGGDIAPGLFFENLDVFALTNEGRDLHQSHVVALLDVVQLAVRVASNGSHGATQDATKGRPREGGPECAAPSCGGTRHVPAGAAAARSGTSAGVANLIQ
jgi:hypothetical protein